MRPFSRIRSTARWAKKKWSLDVHTEQMIEGLLVGALETTRRRNRGIIDENIEPIVSGLLAELSVKNYSVHLTKRDQAIPPDLARQDPCSSS